MANRQSSSFLFALMALLTLGMVIVLPVINQPRAENTTPEETAIPKGDQVAFDNARTSLIYVTGGTFTRGTSSLELERSAQDCLAGGGTTCSITAGADALPAHPVTLNGFWMESHEVTYMQYADFLNTLGPRAHIDGCNEQACVVIQTQDPASPITYNGTSYNVADPARADYPVVNVTWYGASAYCEALGRRLPTEAEWEFAARGPGGDLYPWGSTWEVDAANVNDGTGSMGTQPVGGNVAYASRNGIRDLAGNVAEWMADWYAADFYTQPEARVNNPTGPLTGTQRVLRGGSWRDDPFFARSVQRAAAAPLTTDPTIGFRCVADQ